MLRLLSAAMVVIHTTMHWGAPYPGSAPTSPAPLPFRVSLVMISGQAVSVVRVLAWLLLTGTPIMVISSLISGFSGYDEGAKTLLTAAGYAALGGLLMRAVASIFKPRQPVLVRLLAGERW